MTPQTQPLRIIVVEDHELSRSGIIVSLQKKSNFIIVGEAEQGDEAIQQVEKHQPDLVLMDIELPVMDGIRATQTIKQRFPAVKVLMLTSHDDREVVMASLTAGANAYCMKDISVDRLIQVIEMVHEEAIWLDPAIARLVMKALPREGDTRHPQTAQPLPACPSLLTDREIEILQDIVDGLSNQEIAQHLHISLHTVKVHVRNIMDKLTVSDRTQAAVKAIKEGYVQLD